MAKPKNARARKGLTPDGGLDFTGEVSDDFEFIIAPDQFTAVGDAPGGSFLDLASVVDAEDTVSKVQAIEDFFEQVLVPDSFDLFHERLRDPSNPISLKQALSAFEGLVKIYSGDAERPTQAVSNSQDGSETTGQSSTAPARSKAASTRKDQPSLAS